MNKKIYLAYLITFTYSSIQMILYVTIPYISDTTGVETANIIAAIGVGSLIFSFMGPFWASRSDSLGRKRVLSFGILGLAVSFTLFSCLFIFNNELSMTIKIVMVFISRILYGLLGSAIVPVSQAWQLDLYEKTDHLKVLTRNSMCLNLGRIMGPILVLAKQVNFENVIFCATAWVYLLTLFVFFTSSKTKQQFITAKTSVKDILANWKYSIRESLYPILLALIFTGFVGILYSFLGHHIKTVLSLTGQEATLMFAKIILFLSLVVILMQQLSIMIFQSNWRPRVVFGSIAMVIGTVIMMEAKSSEMIWTSIFFICISTALIPPAYLALTSKSEQNTDKTNIFGKKLGLASVAHSLGYALGTGLIAISMKMKVLPESIVVFFISAAILAVSALMLIKDRKASNVKSTAY